MKTKLDYWPYAMSEARTCAREAYEDWRAGSAWGAVNNLWACNDRCQECLLDDAQVIIREALAAMVAGDADAVAHWFMELGEYLKQDPTRRWGSVQRVVT